VMRRKGASGSNEEGWKRRVLGMGWLIRGECSGMLTVGCVC
jgi:hypothetical protein